VTRPWKGTGLLVAAWRKTLEETDSSVETDEFEGEPRELDDIYDFGVPATLRDAKYDGAFPHSYICRLFSINRQKDHGSGIAPSVVVLPCIVRECYLWYRNLLYLFGMKNGGAKPLRS